VAPHTDAWRRAALDPHQRGCAAADLLLFVVSAVALAMGDEQDHTPGRRGNPRDETGQETGQELS
jgi:hypothetical protein